MEFLKNLLSSRAFWSGLGPLIVAVFNLLGRPLGDSDIQALTVILTFLGGFFGVSVLRARAGRPTSYRTSEKHAEEITDGNKYGVNTP